MKITSLIISIALFATATSAEKKGLRGASESSATTPNDATSFTEIEGKTLPIFSSYEDRYLQSSFADFCWLDSYGRGVGTVITDCPPDKEKIGALCYSKCPSGMKRFGFDCHSVCPKGFRDDGLFCRKAEYGRGAGYPWKWGDGFSDKGMFRRCESKHGRGKCEKWGAIVYPKCRAGYKPFGCCICRPAKPNCSALGLNNGFDLSCAKKVQIGDPTPLQCPSHKENDAGLCYTPCRSGYNGVGPVCWAQKPKGWVNCGMGAAKDSATCANKVFSQITSVAEMAKFVGTLGAGCVTEAAEAPKKAKEVVGLISKLKAQYQKFKPIIQVLQEFSKVVKLSKWLSKLGDLIQKEVENGDITATDAVRLTSSLAAIFDCSGTTDIIAAYTYDTCDTVN